MRKNKGMRVSLVMVALVLAVSLGGCVPFVPII